MHLRDGGDYSLKDGHCHSRPAMVLMIAEMANAYDFIYMSIFPFFLGKIFRV